MAVITAANYKAYAGIGDTSLDARLAVLIPCLQDEVERWCGRLFDTASFTEKIDGSGSDTIAVRNYPITSIASITLLYPDANTSVYASTDYGFSTKEDGRIWLLGGGARRSGLDEDGNPVTPSFGTSPNFPEGRDNLSVVYVGAYGSGAATVPPSLQFALYKTLDEYIAQTRNDPGITSENLGKYAYTQSAASRGDGIFSPQQLARFNGFRRAAY